MSDAQRWCWDGTKAGAISIGEKLADKGFPLVMTEVSVPWGNMRVHTLTRHLDFGTGGTVVCGLELYADQPTDWPS